MASLTLGDIGEWSSGGTPLTSRRDYYGGQLPWATIEDLDDGPLFATATHITELGLENSSAKVVPPETVLIAMYGSIGKLAVTKISCATNQAIAACRPDQSIIVPKFLFYYLLYSRPALVHMGRGGTQSNISQTLIKSFRIVVPGKVSQERAIKRLDAVERLLEQQHEAARHSRMLFESFLAEAFHVQD